MAPAHPDPRWLLLIHQLPPSPAYLRVKTMRQLQKIGAVAVKNSVYVLPSGDEAMESFSWIAREIAAGGGESSLCESSFVGGSSNDAIEALFNRARGKDYQVLTAEIGVAQKGLGKARRLDEGKRSAGEAALARLRRRQSEIARLDFFHAAEGEMTESALVGARTTAARTVGRTTRTPARRRSRCGAPSGSPARACTSIGSPAPGSSSGSSILKRS